MRTLCAILVAIRISCLALSGSVFAISVACFHSSLILVLARRLASDCLGRFLGTDYPQIDELSDTS